MNLSAKMEHRGSGDESANDALQSSPHSSNNNQTQMDAEEEENLNFILNEDDQMNQDKDEPNIQLKENGDGNENGNQQNGEQGDFDEEEWSNEDDDDEDDVQITIGDYTKPAVFGFNNINLNIKGGRQFGTVGPAGSSNAANKQAVNKSSIDLDAVGQFNGQSIYDINLDTLEDKPWRKPGADVTDYFNYGFNEDTWRVYCDRQRKIRQLESQNAFNINATINSFNKTDTHVNSSLTSVPLGKRTLLGDPVNENSKYNSSGSVVDINKMDGNPLVNQVRREGNSLLPNPDSEPNKESFMNVLPGRPGLPPPPPLHQPPIPGMQHPFGFPMPPDFHNGPPGMRPPLGILPQLPPPIGPNGQPFFPPMGDNFNMNSFGGPGRMPLLPPNDHRSMEEDERSRSSNRYDNRYESRDFHDSSRSSRSHYRGDYDRDDRGPPSSSYHRERDFVEPSSSRDRERERHTRPETSRERSREKSKEKESSSSQTKRHKSDRKEKSPRRESSRSDSKKNDKDSRDDHKESKSSSKSSKHESSSSDKHRSSSSSSKPSSSKSSSTKSKEKSSRDSSSKHHRSRD